MDVTQSRLWCYKNICCQDCYQKKIGASKFQMGARGVAKYGFYPKKRYFILIKMTINITLTMMIIWIWMAVHKGCQHLI